MSLQLVAAGVAVSTGDAHRMVPPIPRKPQESLVLLQQVHIRAQIALGGIDPVKVAAAPPVDGPVAAPPPSIAAVESPPCTHGQVSGADGIQPALDVFRLVAVPMSDASGDLRLARGGVPPSPRIEGAVVKHEVAAVRRSVACQTQLLDCVTTIEVIVPSSRQQGVLSADGTRYRVPR